MSPDFSRPISKTRASDDIFRALHAEIVAGRLGPGTRLPSEKELAAQFGVSGPTVRESIRGLTLIGLAEARHGAGTFVAEGTGQIVSLLFGTMISLEKVGAVEVLSVLGSLNELAAMSAARNATEADRQAITDRLAAFDDLETEEQAAQAVSEFHAAIAKASHNLLLEALGGFLTGVQVKLAATLAGGDLAVWRSMFDNLAPSRQSLVDAIEAGDAETAGQCARDFASKALDLVVDMPGAREIRASDPDLSGLLATLVMAGSKA